VGGELGTGGETGSRTKTDTSFEGQRDTQFMDEKGKEELVFAITNWGNRKKKKVWGGPSRDWGGGVKKRHCSQPGSDGRKVSVSSYAPTFTLLGKKCVVKTVMPREGDGQLPISKLSKT